MIFQTIDDKSECIGIYADGKLSYDNFPQNLTKTWKYSGSLTNADVEYACLYCEGLALNQVCPTDLTLRLKAAQKRLRAYIQSFRIAKVDMRDHCIFDLVPEDFLKEFCDIKNKITEHVFDNCDKPKNYEFLLELTKLITDIKYQKLNISTDALKSRMH